MTNYPAAGPIFSGPHMTPYQCRTKQSGLGDPSDADCSAATRNDYFYRAANNTFKPWPATETVMTVPWTRNERSALAGIKSTSYADHVRALALAHAQGAGEALFANTRDELCEGTGTNIFIVAAGVVQTPPLNSGCLAGVTRALVLEACAAAGIAVAETPLPIAVLQTCDEAFLTSSTRDVHPLSRVDQRSMPGVSGVITQRVAQAFRDFVAGRDDP